MASIIKKELIKLYEWLHPKSETLVIRLKFHLRIMSMKKTIRYIEKHHCSIARFGDGEFDCMLNERDIGFQKKSDKLQLSLVKTMSNTNPNLLLCLAHSFNYVLGFKPRAKEIWLSWGRNGHQKKVYHLVCNLAGKKYRFGDALITRPYIDYKSQNIARSVYPMLQKLWNDRDVLIVEGKYSRLGVGNDLFSNTKSIKRLLAPEKDAFDVYDEILKAVIDNYTNELVLIALGPTATILASDLCDLGIQSLDIGHIDIEYEWFLRKSKWKEPIKGKYVNEAGDTNKTIEELESQQYQSEIICIIEP